MNYKSIVFLVIATLMFGATVGMAQTEWEKYPGNPVLDLGPPVVWDDHQSCYNTVLFDGLMYHTWYSGYDGSNYRIGYAISFDGTSWTKHPDNPVLDLGAPGTWDDNEGVVPLQVFPSCAQNLISLRDFGSLYILMFSMEA
ncbi:hypothetical protein H8E77_22890 [bacterium]|nr:hypothetical protein [bacterium]